ncbi:interferon-induced protein with tetratricopeptide repeats 5-like [Brachyhypopomus gauderio]|uniref:interferon-induced protein with tetratricopeptide repeats 5-like n=1 Tax=Brachyhypopomus gauderio TaxID=698409 RepID=UPI004041E667
MSLTQDTFLKSQLLQLECHFTWALRKEDTNLTDLLIRLEDQIDLEVGREAGVARTYSSLGFVKYLLGSYNEALSNLQRSEELTRQYHGDNCNNCNKMLMVTYGNFAWLHYHMEARWDCESYLNKLKEINEKHPPASSSVPYPEVLGEKGWALLKFSRKYYERAQECFRKALELEPDEGEWNAGYAIALYRTNPDLSSTTDCPVIKQLRRAVHANPDDDVLKVLLGIRLSAYKKFSEAESLVEQALERSPEHPHVIRYVGKFFRNKGSVERSIALLKRALERTPKSSFIHHQLALCYKRKKMSLFQAGSHHSKGAEIQRIRDQCIYHLEEATTLKPSFILAMSELAVQYGENQDISKAEELFHTTFQTAKQENGGCQVVTVYYAEFQQYSKRCEPLAIKHYKEGLRMNPNTVGGRRSTACLKRIAEKRMARNPNDGEALGILGLIHKENGDKHKAIEYYEKALSYVDDDEYLSALCELRLSLQ